MPAGIQSRTQFLILAEFCQKVISSLLDYINGRSHYSAALWKRHSQL